MSGGLSGALRAVALALLLAASMLATGSARAQDQNLVPEASRIDQLKELDKAGASIAPTAVSSDLLGPDGTVSLQSAFKAYYDYRVSGYQHRQRVFAWQLLSSRIIFVVVIFLVLVGVYFSWLQFRAAMRPGTPFSDKPVDTTFEASTTGFKVSSPVLGVIILALSLAFFYLYLLYVYPITDTF
jgi:hypothetical protein